MMNISVGYYTDEGDVKKENQDSVFVKKKYTDNGQIGLFIVADGCGGMKFGDKISRLTVSHFSKMWNEESENLAEPGTDDCLINDMLERTIKKINSEAVHFSEQVNSNVGSTLSLILVADGKYYIKNIGDSRVYVKRGRKLVRLTEDQTLMADMLRNGELTRKEAKDFKKKNVLTMCIGMFDEVRFFSRKGRIKNNDVFLVCSDGLYNSIEESEIVKIINNRKIPFEDKCRKIREKIEFGKARDNVSLVLCKCSTDGSFAQLKKLMAKYAAKNND